ncbi:hypothetical protein CC1G_10088 [Coprinopsis cinerea okayama7|uniref:Uncharacterized protein n=1 Tax=Coprinopsis cinerea (strain Okayama-7 / 130 / ATCC MYA-4618 / FGSC 9003) TaxID=240176 RepID=A8NDU9_COPC7|nr:hypothetical protein CC1G_10088 [Coprinopsis cinerea okayama7\|eukprot:XP_001832869.2 hypothetical protein CC1G_10088 [Coprinopsis cinerea okayama7\
MQFPSISSPLPDPALLPYASGDNILPAPDHLRPALDLYLQDSSTCLATLSEQISILETLLGATHFQRHTAHLSADFISTVDQHRQRIREWSAGIDQKVAYLKALLARTRTQQMALAEERARYAAIRRVGILDLPFEILGDILLHWSIVTGEGTSNHQRSRFKEHSPFAVANLRLVCTRWNDVILGTRGFWRGLVVDIDRWIPDASRSTLSTFVNAWFDRAGEEAPLRLAFVGSNRPDLTGGQLLRAGSEFVDILFRRKRHWKEWHLNSTLLSDLIFLFGGLQKLVQKFTVDMAQEDYTSALSRLKILSISKNPDEYIPEEQSKMLGCNLFDTQTNANALPLESLYVHSPLFITKSFYPHLPSHVRFLHIHAPGKIDVPKDKIFLLPRLEELILELGPRSEIDREGFPATNQSFQRLILIGRRATESLPKLFKDLTLPSLNLLRFEDIGMVDFEYNWRGNEIEDFLVRNTPGPKFALNFENCGLVSSCIGGIEFVIEKFNLGGITHLCLASPDFLVHGSKATLRTLYQTAQVIACRTYRDAGFREVIEALRSHCMQQETVVYLPRPVKETVWNLNSLIGVMNVRPVSKLELDTLFETGIRGHQYSEVVSDYSR